MDVQIIAKRYADALYTLEGTVKDTDKIWEELHDIAYLAETCEDFKNVIKNPTILDSEKEAIFKSLKESGKISNVIYDFLCLLVEKQRLDIVVDIDKEIHKLVLAKKGEIEAVAVFAALPSEKDQKELADKLSVLTGKKVLLKETVDSGVIGGVKVRMGSLLYDATIKGQLEKLRSEIV